MLSRNVLVHLKNRRILQVKGADAHRFLQGIITNDMKNVSKPNDALYGAFLTTKGRVLGDCNVVQVEADTFLMDYDVAVSAELEKHWKRYKLRMKATLEDKTDSLAVYTGLPAAISSSGFAYNDASSHVQELLQLNQREASEAHGAIFRDPRGDAFGVRAILPSAEKLNAGSDFEEADIQAYTNRRFFLGAAEGIELSDTIPLEADLELLHGVSFRKGCYVGQELTARTQFKGNVRKRFVPVALIPSAQQDLANELAQQPFQRIDADGLNPLREYLVSEAATTLSLPDDELKILKPDSTKAVGSVVVRGKDLGVAVAMMRLEHVMAKEDGEAPLMQFTTADGAFHAVPYQPTWWPQLDLKTGKMVL